MTLKKYLLSTIFIMSIFATPAPVFASLDVPVPETQDASGYDMSQETGDMFKTTSGTAGRLVQNISGVVDALPEGLDSVVLSDDIISVLTKDDIDTSTLQDGNIDWSKITKDNIDWSQITPDQIDMSSLSMDYFNNFDYGDINPDTLTTDMVDFGSLGLDNFSDLSVSDLKDFNVDLSVGNLDFDAFGLSESSLGDFGLGDKTLSDMGWDDFSFSDLKLSDEGVRQIMENASLKSFGIENLGFDELKDLSFSDLNLTGVSLDDIGLSQLSLDKLSSLDLSKVSLQDIGLGDFSLSDLPLDKLNLKSLGLDNLSLDNFKLDALTSKLDFSKLSLGNLNLDALSLDNFKLDSLMSKLDLSKLDLSNLKLDSLNVLNLDLSKLDLSQLKLPTLNLSNLATDLTTLVDKVSSMGDMITNIPMFGSGGGWPTLELGRVAQEISETVLKLSKYITFAQSVQDFVKQIESFGQEQLDAVANMIFSKSKEIKNGEKELMDFDKMSKFSVPQNSIEMARKYVRDTFFMMPSEEKTDEENEKTFEEIYQNREQYIQDITSDNLAFAYYYFEEGKKNSEERHKAIESALSGSKTFDDKMAVLALAKTMVVRERIDSVVLQLRLFEQGLANALLGTDVRLTDPETIDELRENSEQSTEEFNETMKEVQKENEEREKQKQRAVEFLHNGGKS